MLLKTPKNSKPHFKSLTLRLAVWYTSVFLVITLMLFGGLYFLLNSMLLNQTDQTISEKARSVSNILYNFGVQAGIEQMGLEAQAAGDKAIFLRMIDTQGNVVSSTNLAAWQNLEITQHDMDRLLESADGSYFTTLANTDTAYPVRAGYFNLSGGIILQIGQIMEVETSFLKLFRLFLMLGLIAVFIISAVLSAILSKRILRMINKVTQTARAIAESPNPQLNARVQIDSSDEISQMALTFNTMLGRIQTLMQGMEEMSDNMAHDLKSAVTRVRGLSEVTLVSTSTSADYEKTLGDIIAECDSLLDLINNILLISKAKHGVYDGEPVLLNLNTLATQAYELFVPLAESKNLRLSLALDTQPVEVLADKRLLQRALANLIDNAIKYTQANGKITIATRQDSNHSILDVQDTGIGIVEKDLEKIFQRFFRSDVSRSAGANAPGMGLGLSFVKAAIEAMGGQILVQSAINKGSTFSIIFKSI